MDKNTWERNQYGIALDPKADEKQASENLNGEARISVRERMGDGLKETTRHMAQCKDQGGAQKTFNLKTKAAEF